MSAKIASSSSLRPLSFTFPTLTVDAYAQAIPFYLKNDFAFLSSEDEGQRTRMMFFDLNDLN